ncbi:3-dehydroquinate synthase II [Paenibacillus sp. NEAU-GSW1]|uniref:3-dehydroquinate synthase II n=1 Tax=Paenibacillus sp. NEAU-GSW1 TaxID=2682486 RepID=UPI0012E22714|nr:3-dehydroquinate synthase II [Paenibacillus sp. NEAU-GSW1]MUT64889.1 3-dehydroquinate synthase [Paenibacillus sp. NEAU-GSW1]
MNKIVWYDARTKHSNMDSLIVLVNQSSGFDGILYHASGITEDTFKHSNRLYIAVQVDEIESLESLRSDYPLDKVIIVSMDKQVLAQAKGEGLQTAYYAYIYDENSMNAAYLEGANHQYAIVEFKHETNIPLELIIAKLQQANVNILKLVQTVDDALVSKEVMEVGCDGIILNSARESDIVELNSIAERIDQARLEIVTAKVTRVQHLGPGERACIDTTSLLTKEESMIIGSTSGGGLLVCSETHYLPYMNTRPFRVNAGAVHSYVWCPNDTTAYITDLRVGSSVSVIDIHGKMRTVNVGRMKVEVRPLLLIEAEYEGQKINAIVQDDWHIRIFDGKRQPQNATAFKVGDEILAYVCESGRHVGVKIDETITEQ